MYLNDGYSGEHAAPEKKVDRFQFYSEKAKLLT